MPPVSFSEALGVPVGGEFVLADAVSLPSGALEVAGAGAVVVLLGEVVVLVAGELALGMLPLAVTLPVALEELVPSGSFVLSVSLPPVHAATISANTGRAPR